MTTMQQQALEIPGITTMDMALNGWATATFSMDRRYRYRLWRRLSEQRDPHQFSLRLACVLLNPSIASATTEDPTLRKCIGFARRWGYHEIVIVNLFALIATDPAELLDAADPVGSANETFLRQELDRYADAVLLGWGTHRAVRLATSSLRVVTESRAKASCLGINKDGSPKHPLYVPYATKPTIWSAPQ
jgi:hypothetical protein